MSGIAISASGVAKEYEVGAREANYQTLRESIMGALAAPFSRVRRLSGNATSSERFWALRDVSFDVKAGEVLGVIGRNGAGKSTLLKILGRITEPTRGTITVRGRVASLLEVGTGFHPELTGRENIFLNGAILGMSRAEIQRKFDEIVAFAEVERFLDTPVKRYSSGMYVRLAFAVAANLEPEILLVDEVLAVGDLDFQKKCLDRMKGLAGGAHTIIFVSHNIAAIHALCDRCLLLNQGTVAAVGPTADVVASYLESHAPRQSFVRQTPASKRPCIMSANLRTEAASPELPGTLLRVSMTIRSAERTRVGLWFRIKDQIGSPVAFAGAGQFNPDEIVGLEPGDNRFEFVLPIDMLALGDYSLGLAIVVPTVAVIEDLDDCLRFTVERAPRKGAVRALPQSWGYGCIELPVQRVDVAQSSKTVQNVPAAS
jgi:lipopolysaccharide transport system ATP-binding protein